MPLKLNCLLLWVLEIGIERLFQINKSHVSFLFIFFIPSLFWTEDYIEYELMSAFILCVIHQDSLVDFIC